MKRRGFFGALLGLTVLPFVPAKVKEIAKVSTPVTCTWVFFEWASAQWEWKTLPNGNSTTTYVVGSFKDGTQ